VDTVRNLMAPENTDAVSEDLLQLLTVVLGPERHLPQGNDSVAIGGQADSLRTPWIGRC
jgi:hypothetical protein